MAIIVHKYGGTSVASLECMQKVASHIIAAREQGNDVVVVVSAMGDETDRLLEMAQAINPEPHPREYSALLSTGEQVSMSLLAMILINRGCPAVSFTGWQARIKTNHSVHKARIMDIDREPIKKQLNEGRVVIVAGFQGIDEEGNITTLGRGGSDTTAVALATSLEADECRIYTDVDGVYTTDPRLVPTARRMKHVTFEEMLELSSLGAKVLQIRAVEFASRYNMPLRVLSTFKGGPGTLISSKEKTMENPIISGIAFNRNEAKLTIRSVPDKPGVASQIISAISDSDIDIDMIIQNVANDATTDFSFTIGKEDYDKAIKLLSKVTKNLDLPEDCIDGDKKIAKLSLVGVGMRSHVGIASKMFTLLAKEGINIQLITTSEIKVSVIVDEKYTELGVRALHAGFELDMEPTEEFDPL